MPEDTIPLKRFFEAVEERLSACSADELRSILRAMAQVVAPKDRQGFLEALVPSKEAGDVIQSALRQDDLLSEIDDLVAEIRAEMDRAEDAYDATTAITGMTRTASVLTRSSSRRWPNSSTGRPACSIAAICPCAGRLSQALRRSHPGRRLRSGHPGERSARHRHARGTRPLPACPL